MKIRRLVLAAGAAAAIVVALPCTALAATSAHHPGSHALPASTGMRPVPIKDLKGTLAGPSAVYVPAAGSRVSTFDFSNSNIAHFHATLTFNSRYSFTISNVTLSDTLKDSRSVLALAEDQNFAYAKGTNPALYTWKNDLGAGNTIKGATFTFESSDPVQYVRIALYAANLNGESSIVYSLNHDNPYY